MRKGEAAFLICVSILAGGLTLSGLGEGYPREALVFPVIVTVFLAAFSLIRTWEARRSPEGEVLGQEDEPAPDLRSLARPILAVFAVIPSLLVLGYQVGLPFHVFVFLLLKRVPLHSAALISVGTAAFIYLIFDRALQVILPTGLLGMLMNG